MILLNFSHPLTSAQLSTIKQLGREIEQGIDIKTQLDPAQPFAEQGQALVESVGLSSQEWQTSPLLVNLPSLNVIAALVLAELHGRMGYFPAVLRLRPVASGVPPQFEIAEIMNLQAVRDAARSKR